MPDPVLIVRPQVDFVKERRVREHGSPLEAFGLSETGATRTVWVPWEQRFIAARAILGYSRLQRDEANAIVGLNRLTPLPHPDKDNADANAKSAYLYASKITEIKPYKPKVGELPPAVEQSMVAPGGVASRSTFLLADITVQYENPMYYVLEDNDENTGWPTAEYSRFFRLLEVTDAVEYITMPAGTLKLAKDGGGEPTGTPLGFNAGKIFPKQTFRFRWCRLPDELYSPYFAATNWQKRIWGDPLSGNIPLIGTVNSDTFLGRRAGTILFESIRPIANPGLFGDIYEWDFEFVFHYDPNGWNQKYFYTSDEAKAAQRGFYLYTATGEYYAPDAIPDGRALYNVRNLDVLFDVRDTIT